MKKTIQYLWLPLAALLGSALSAKAAIVSNPQSGDIFLGFRADGGQGGSTSYLINLGPDTQFRNPPAGTAASGSTFNVFTGGDIGLDLVATFGNNWNTRSDLSWGIFGVRSSASSTIYASREQNPIGLVTSPWEALDATGRNGTASAITSVVDGVNGYRGRDATANSTVAVFQPNTAEASSYARQVATAGTTDFGSLSGWSSIEGDFAAGTSGTALDFYRVAGSGVSRLGTFNINDAGVLSFAAVPEPSAALTGLVLGGAALLRRRRSN
jgi:MYXO-CTERM domain-containing protein